MYTTTEITRGRLLDPAAIAYTQPQFTTLGNLDIGAEVRWYRYWRFEGQRFNAGTVLQHLKGDLTRFAIQLDVDRVLVVPMFSGLRIRITQGRR